MGVPPAARDQVMRRSHGTCEGCGDRATDAHHRQPRGMGGVYGSAVAVSHGMPNLLALCRTCHRLTEEEPELCRRLGWLVPHGWGSVSVPARLVTPNGVGWWYLLHCAGYQWVEDSVARAVITEMYGVA